MKPLVDRASYATALIALVVLAWSVLGHPAPGLSKAIAFGCCLAIFTAHFARSAFGSSQPLFSRQLTLVGFWLCAAALAIQGVLLFLALGAKHLAGA
jgi:hypothetical protein